MCGYTPADVERPEVGSVSSVFFLRRRQKHTPIPSNIKRMRPPTTPPMMDNLEALSSPPLGTPLVTGLAVAVAVSFVSEEVLVGTVRVVGVDDGIEMLAGARGGGALLWSEFLTHSESLLQEYPNGQQSLPHFGSSLSSAVVLTLDLGSCCNRTSQRIGAMISHPSRLSQQRVEVLPASWRQTLPLGQQKLLGRLFPHCSKLAGQVACLSKTVGRLIAEASVAKATKSTWLRIGIQVN